jgi:uncharacterized protein YoxC
MNTVFLGLITLAILVLVGFVINAVLESKKTLIRLRNTMDTVETTIVPTVEELKLTIMSIRKITDDVGSVSEDLSGSVKEIILNVKNASEAISCAAIRSGRQVSGMKAGVKTGLVYFLSNIFVKR